MTLVRAIIQGLTKDGPGTVTSGVTRGLTATKERLMPDTMPRVTDSIEQAR